MTYQVHPVTADRWPDLEALFGPQGAYSGCWCMHWRLMRPQFKELGEEGRKAALRHLTHTDPAPGVLAYQDGAPVGWCSIGPREAFAALEASRTLKRVDDQPVWSYRLLLRRRDGTPLGRHGGATARRGGVRPPAGGGHRRGLPN